jgi:UDP-N-acetylmuramoylalanine--D-glutamate ligase
MARIAKNKSRETRTLPRDYLPARATVMGAGRSGLAAARLLLDKGVDVFLSDTCTRERIEFALATNNLAALPHEANGHTRRVLDAEIIVLSPGISLQTPILVEATRRGIPIWSEMELAFRQSIAPYWAVTGSTGKSTTVSLLGSVLQAAGIEHVVAGNIGLPLSTVAPKIGKDGVVVAEVSSFQLETIDLFQPRIGAILNLMKNHLDRYPDAESYYEAKKRIVGRMLMDDTLVLNGTDEELLEWSSVPEARTRVIYFGAELAGKECVWLDGTRLRSRVDGAERSILDVREMKLKGLHNHQNAAAVAAMALRGGVQPDAIAEGLVQFAGLHHRLEFVREIDGVTFYNDSKATTAEAVQCAITAFDNNVHLIAGGKDKGCDFSIVGDAVKQHVKTVHLIGEASERIARTWKGLSAIRMESDLEQAVVNARKAAVEGDVVVLSPGCSSFDMFAGFEKRGEMFREIVHGIKKRVTK